ncbi:hypothetical protein ANANG_G00309730 [Anguilla anguilla]|uniref:Uncharacterized protein n=1 Tax=Anguilla anguilla TaxID=7936 RepID=A0A9D3LI24_ANGAN|nr:hypothetical protein ANANG_G00309730 [Anguilla anguilla]
MRFGFSFANRQLVCNHGLSVPRWRRCHNGQKLRKLKGRTGIRTLKLSVPSFGQYLYATVVLAVARLQKWPDDETTQV